MPPTDQPLPLSVRRGEPIRAADINAILRAIETLTDAIGRDDLRGFGGLIGLITGSGSTLGRAARPRRMILGRIVAVAGVDVNGDGPMGSVLYDITLLDDAAADPAGGPHFEDHAPELGRPTADTAELVRASEVGDPVIVWRLPDGEGAFDVRVQVLNERLAPGEACEP